MEIVIEVVEPGRRAPSIKYFQQPEISVGRGWDNDLVITDMQVDASHCVLKFDEETDTLSIQDLDTTNGTLHNKKQLENSTIVHFGSLITVGQTSFKIHRKTDEVVPARVYTRSENALDRASHPLIAIGIAVVAVFLWQYLSFLGGAQLFDWNSQLQALLSVGFALVAWGLFWGLITKLFKHQFKFWPHLGLAAAIMIMRLALGEFETIVSFNTLSTSIAQFVEAINTSVLIFIWVVLGLIITTNVKAKTRLTTASTMVGLFLLTSFLLPKLNTDQWVGYVPLDTTSLPTSLHISPTIPQTDFYQIIGDNLDESMERAIEAKEEQAENS